MSTPPSRSSSSRAAGPAAPEGEQDKADERRGSARPVGDPHRGKNYKLGAVAPKLGAQPRSSGRSPERRRRSGAGAGGPEPARGPGPEPRAGKTGAGDRRGGGDGPAPRECQAAGRAMRGWRGGASSGRRPVRDPAPAARQRRRARLSRSRVRSADDPPSWATRPRHRWPSSLRSSQAPGQVRRRGSTSAVAEAPRFARRGAIRASHPGQRPA